MSRPAWPGPGPAPEGGQWVSGSLVLGDVIMVSGVGGNVTIGAQRPPYLLQPYPTLPQTVPYEQARRQPGRLLLAGHEVVPFTGRGDDLAAVADWLATGEAVSVRLVYAAGGQGKTRLAGQVVTECAEAGWAVWRVVHQPDFTGASRIPMPGGGSLLAVVDYADRWPASHLLGLVTHLAGLNLQTGVRVRILLLARSASPWWSYVRTSLRSSLGVEASAQELPPLGAQADRAELYAQARRSFAAALRVEGTEGLPLPAGLNDDEAFGQVLTVHMAGLVAVDAHLRGRTPPTRPHALSAYLLEREQAHWYRLHTRAEEPRGTGPEVMARTVYLATLTGAQVRSTAETLLRHAELTEPGVTTILDDHRFCYPSEDPGTVLEPLHPDRLGEDLIGLTTPGHPHTSDEIAWQPDDWAATVPSHLLTPPARRPPGKPPPAWVANAITVLVETAHRWPHIGTHMLDQLLREHPYLALSAGGATLTRLAGIANLDTAVLEALDALMPADRHVDLDIAAAAISDRLFPLRLAAATDPAQQVQLYIAHSYRLFNAGRHTEAFVPANTAVELSRGLAEADPVAHLPALATSLSNLSPMLTELGRHQEAVAPAAEAVSIYRRLADTNPVAHLLALPSLATSLNNLCACLAGLGRHQEALPAAGEAVAIRRRLAETDPGTYLPDLAASLNNLGAGLIELGRYEEGLGPVEETVSIYRRLAEAEPDAYLPDVAMSLDVLGEGLARLGRHQRALAATAEAVSIYRRVAGVNPDAHLHGLARSLTNLCPRLGELGRRQEAVAPAEEAVSIYRRLATVKPDAYLPDLSKTLHYLGNKRAGLGRYAEALAATQEAVTIRRRLAEADPDAYLSDLSESLTSLGEDLTRSGRREEGLAATQEAVAIRRRLAEADPDAHLPDLAGSLNNLGICLAGLGRRWQTLAATQEVVSVYRRLAEASPDVYLDDLATSMNTLMTDLADLRQEVLAADTSSLAAFESATDQLSAASFTLADVLERVGRVEEAADLRRRLGRLTR